MWLLQDEVAQTMRDAAKAGLCPTTAQRDEFIERVKAASAFGGDESSPRLPRNMAVSGDVAEIRVVGALTPKPDLFALIFGGGNTTYEDIISALARAQSDPAIKRCELFIDSPGGLLDGLFEALAAIEQFTKPIKVRAARAASAAYALAAVAGPIEATTAAASFGSIGIATKVNVDDEVIEITSTQAPKKRPDPRTEEGKAVIREYLDAVHELFAGAIARGRKVNAKTVNEEFGRGATVLASEAKRRGMIDKIAKPALRPVGEDRRARATQEGDEAEEPMDLTTLKAQHPELYAAVVAETRAAGPTTPPQPPPITQIPTTSAPPRGAGQEHTMDLKTLKLQHPEAYEAAVREGEIKERDRVVAHLTMGEQCGDLKIAIGAITAGDGMTMTLTSQYLCAGMNRSDRAARQTETDATAAVLGQAQPDEPSSLGEAVASAVERGVGKIKRGSDGEPVVAAVAKAKAS